MFERYFYNDDGTLVDRTKEWTNPYSDTGAWDAKSYLYVSSFLPFNHKYFDITTPEDIGAGATGLTVDIWFNDSWTPVADIIDYTAEFTGSGIIYFTPDKDEGWEQEGESEDIPELSTTKVYNCYWLRFGFDASSDSALVINYIGHRFADSTSLYTMYPMLNNTNIMGQFKSGKTDWTEQLITASDHIIADLRRRNLIVSKGQILDIHRYELPCIHKAAELIFAAMGPSYYDMMNQAKKAYDDIMNTDGFGIDLNGNGNYDRSEKTVTRIRRMTR